MPKGAKNGAKRKEPSPPAVAGQHVAFGKLILFGEHFVVYKVPALVSAVSACTTCEVELSGDSVNPPLPPPTPLSPSPIYRLTTTIYSGVLGTPKTTKNSTLGSSRRRAAHLPIQPKKQT